MKKEGRASDQKVASVERALAIFEAFGNDHKRLSLTELTQRTGFYRSTVLRLTDLLRRFGYIQRDSKGQFSLGPALWRLGLIYQSTLNLEDHIRPVLAELVAATGESAALYVRQGDKRVCLYRHHSSSPLRHHIDEGEQMPLGRGSGAHVLATHTGGTEPQHDVIRRQGYCIAMGETDPETGGIAVPLFGAGGEFVGALGVAGFRAHFEGEKGERILAVLMEKGQALSRVLDGRRD